jgi:glucuronide carrier protein/probable glucitol transport protein GutA
VEQQTNLEMDRSLFTKIPVWRKLTWGLGDTANNMSWTFVTSYLAIFYTDVFLIPAAAVSLLFLISRFWDAVNDPIVGMMADNTKSRWGRYRPWVIFGTVPLAVLTILTFTAHPGWPLGGKLVYAYITYGLLVLAYTCVNLTYGSLNSVVTQDPAERGSLASWRLGLAVVGGIIVTLGVTRLMSSLSDGDPTLGYMRVAIFFTCIMVPLHWLCAGTNKEVIMPPKENKLPLFQLIKSTFKNKPFLIAMAGMAVMGFGNYGRSAFYAYYFTYVLGDMGKMLTFILFAMFPMFFGSMTGAWVSDRFKSKGKTIILSSLLSGILLIVQYVLFALAGLFNYPLFYFFTACGGLVSGWFWSMIYGVIPDTVEYGQLITNTRNDGFISAYGSFWNKVGMALGTAGGTAMLAILNYVPNAAEQSPTVIGGINFMMFLMPAILYFVIAILFKFYPLDYKAFEEVVKQLQDRNNKQTV